MQEGFPVQVAWWDSRGMMYWPKARIADIKDTANGWCLICTGRYYAFEVNRTLSYVRIDLDEPPQLNPQDEYLRVVWYMIVRYKAQWKRDVLLEELTSTTPTRILGPKHVLC